ncbi:Uncharacterised protein [uncultured archaeon]|nr:Uncharacterised protein [uncultured archaeon]
MADLKLILLPKSAALKQTGYSVKTESGEKEAFIVFYNKQSPMPRNGLAWRMGNLHSEYWREKDGKRIGYYVNQAKARNEIDTPVIALKNNRGWIGASIYPVTLAGSRLEDVPCTWKEVAGISGDGQGEMWKSDNKDGKIIICPQVSGDVKKMGGSSGILIKQAVLPLAAYGIAAGKLEWAGAYSRPSAYGKVAKEMSIGAYLTEVREGKHKQEFALNMHWKYGGKFVRADKNGCPADKMAGGYNIVVDYTPEIIGNLIKYLEKIAGVVHIEVSAEKAPEKVYANGEYAFARKVGGNCIYELVAQ